MLQKEFVDLNDTATRMQLAYRVKEEKYAALKKQNQKTLADNEAFKKKVKSYKNRKNQEIGNANKDRNDIEK